MGSVQLAKGETELAEDSLRRSIEMRPTLEAKNDLAWLLVKRGAYVEAEQLAREAIDENQDLGAAWDTLGLVLLRTGRHDEADEALGRALVLSQHNPTVWIHLAELRVKQKDAAGALEAIESAEAKRAFLSAEELETLRMLRRQLP
jgi:Flp pilus assembly protein TadD